MCVNPILKTITQMSENTPMTQNYNLWYYNI